MTENTLYYGDNLRVLRDHVRSETVDLVYLDPPFNSNATYNVLFGDHGKRAPAQIAAFEDTWHWDEAASAAFDDALAHGGKVADAMKAFAGLLGHGDMLAYLSMMAPRLVELRRVLQPTGSLYLHCDPTASHYLKVLLDAVFGPECFRNEITWQRTNVHNDAKRWGTVADSILYYGKSPNVTWNSPRAPHTAAHVASKYTKDDGDGRGPYMLDNMTSPNPRPNMMYEWKGFSWPAKGWRYEERTMTRLDAEGRIYYPRHSDGTLDTTKRPRLKRYLKEMAGSAMNCVWTDIPPINSQASERLGYPTQKPLALLERIISASSNPGDMVLDPFCGCGTTVAAAQKLERRWQGIDITHIAVNLMKNRLRDAYGLEPRRDYAVVGEPTTVDGAAELAASDPYGFQNWALGLAGAQWDGKKGADRGIDGRIVFRDEGSRGDVKQIIFSVKAGHTNVAHVRDLKGVLEREGAQMGVLLSLQEPTRPMREEAAATGGYVSPYDQRRYPRLQLVTVGELLDGRAVLMPPQAQTSVTFRRAERELPRVAEEQAEFLLGDDGTPIGSK